MSTRPSLVLATVVAALAAIAISGCAHANDCADCPTAALTANGSDHLDAHAGDMIVYAWSSTNADHASSTVTMAPAADACGNVDGPWVVDSLEGTTGPAALLDCQAGTTYTLELAVTQTTTGETATATVTISVQ